MKPLLLPIVLATMIAPVSCFQAAAASEQFDSVVRAVRAAREKLTRGVVRIKGTEGLVDLERPRRGRSEPFEILIAFDADQLRFDTREMGWVADPNTGQETRAQIERRYLRTPQKTATWATGQRGRAGDNLPPIGRPELFDVRTLGLRDWVGRRGDLDDTLTTLTNSQSTKAVDASNPERLGISLLTAARGGRAVELRVWVSPLQDFSATRTECLSRSGPEEPWILSRESDTTWRQIRGTWVPVRHEWSLYSSPQRRKFLRFKLAWESVNEPVDPELFAIESLRHAANVEDAGE